ncbi:M6 family metalloprotease domain-containing protein, partial [Candidatus Poribacteria bacterium]|nr:M6 family metalloprotease domain-containing protein [Candidatus Poribacteria bacterium]
PDGREFALVLRVDFSDTPGVRSRAQLDGYLFGEGVSLASYFAEVSYGKMTVSGGPGGGSYPRRDAWYRMPKMMGYYGEGRIFVERYQELVKHACDAADADVDFRDYDRDGDGILDHLILLHAGNDEASSGVPADIWSILVPDVGRAWDGVRVDTTVVIGEEPSFKSPHLGVWFHEFLHDFGTPETYVVGTLITDHDQQWCIMGLFGPYQGNGPARDGTQPSHLCGYLKWDLDGIPENGRHGWVTPIELDDNTIGLQVPAFSAPEGHDPLYKVNLPGTRGKEFFLIENRTKRGGSYDQDIPDEGLIIWHVDESVERPTLSVARRLWVEDPSDPIHRNLTTAITAGAAYSAEDSQTSFTPSTNPNTNTNGGAATGISILNIGPSGPRMTLDLFFGDTYEPNDTAAEAYPIVYGQRYDSFLYDADDFADVYRLTVAAGDRVRIAIAHAGSARSLRAELHDARGVAAQGRMVRATGDARESVELLYRALSDGSLDLVVTPGTGASLPIAYTITVDRDTEAFGTPPRFVQAMAAPNPARYGEPLRFRAAFAHPGLDRLRVELFDTSGQRIAVRDMDRTDAGDLDIVFEGGTRPAPGVYYALFTAEQSGQVSKRLVKFAVE